MSKKQIISITKSACQKLTNIAQETNTQHKIPDKKDEIIQKDNYILSVCNQSLIHVLGTEIDWKKDIMGESFHFNNPMAKSKCGCGTSFTSKGL